MTIKRPIAPKPEKVQLGEGVLVFNFNPDNWDDPESIPFGATRGGGNYNVERTNLAMRFDGDKGENTKGLKRTTEWVITIVANALELDLPLLEKVMPGETKTVEQEEGATVPTYKKYRPNIDFKDTDYLKNLAYITQTYAGNLVAYVIENPLGDGALSVAFEDKNEVVPETTFTAHFDPEKMSEVPTYVVHYDPVPAV
jgi:hypothetical protein